LLQRTSRHCRENTKVKSSGTSTASNSISTPSLGDVPESVVKNDPSH